ncbi:uncharacterized protein LOC120265838 [Dioscorea cayenensis subsp. rotundata]|uniref:Uncharacterized protein LOC120265838 n=1 Tax=Dioscorea cayennensis subsp. rotundata TaxID=55577 RepID=A0AB40BTH8_DIOCR|nr:uncharacterized protein LOC120265838 [Dioscorea cayenensis subsp. rotundata]
MALRSLDNALPASLERPRKAPKISPAKPPLYPSINNENSSLTPPPPKPADQSIEYISSENLAALSDPQNKIKSVLEELESKDWIRVCEALNDVRRLALHHQSLLHPILENVMLVIVKSMKSPRSALCKTSIMASTDIFQSFGYLLPSISEDACAFDHLLLQLLMKASQDKKFVCEEAEKALEAMASFISSLPLIKKLQPCVNHANLRVRAKAAVSISKCVSKMDIETMKEFGLVVLLQIAAELLNDKLPEAREAARSIINSVHNGFSKNNELKVDDESSATTESWQDFCSSNLPPISAQSVAKIVLQ